MMKPDAHDRCCEDEVHVDELPVAVGHEHAKPPPDSMLASCCGSRIRFCVGFIVVLVLVVATPAVGHTYAHFGANGLFEGQSSAFTAGREASDLTLWHEYTAAVAGQRVCPGSPSKAHAKCQLSVVVDAPCTVALRTVHGRVRGKNGWMDCKEPKPGMYSGAAWAAARVTGNGAFRDKLAFHFEPQGGADPTSGTCKLTACSESQVDSIIDYSTNYCNLRNLYGHSTGFEVLDETLTSCKQHDLKECCKFHDVKAQG